MVWWAYSRDIRTVEFFGQVCNARFRRQRWTYMPPAKELVMPAQLLVVYPPPKDPAEFEEHLLYAGPRSKRRRLV
jgi:hypothetical protein